MKRHYSTSVAIAVALTLVSGLAAGCSLGQTTSRDSVRVVIGYQSKTINTVTAGTLLKAQGYLEKRLDRLTEQTGTKYSVEWQDYDTGAPITAQMVAEKIDIGSMGDYPLLINGSRTQANDRAQTEIISVTGYNPLGALNMVVVPENSPAQTLTDLKGQKISASVGSAGHGTLVQALSRVGLNPNSDVEVLNQQPQVGSSALDSRAVSALAQFVAWPGLLVFQNKARLLYDGAELGVPTLHGVVVRRAYAGEHPEVLDAFLLAQLDATRYVQQNPLAASKIVADSSGLPQEVVYLYNGPGGATSFDPTLKPRLKDALKGDVPYLQSIGDFADLDVDNFVNDEPLRRAYATERAQNYDDAVTETANPTAVHGTDPVCNVPASNPATAGEIWLDGQDSTQPAATPTCLLRGIGVAQSQGQQVRAAYVPDSELGTRWFADKAVWVRDIAAPADEQWLAFTTPAATHRYLQSHRGASVVPYRQAVAEA